MSNTPFAWKEARRQNPRSGSLQRIDSIGEHAQAAVGEIDREEDACAGKEVAPVAGHRRMMKRTGR